VLVVEGYMDVVALAQMGVGYAVASLGTACTPAHVQKLIRQADRIVFSFDGDAAGQRAAWRALENTLALTSDDKHFSFLFLPKEHDPDTYIREFGREAFEAEIGRAMPLSKFLLRELSNERDLTSAEGRAGVVEAAKPHLQRITAPGLRLAITQELGALAGMDAREVERLCELTPQASNLRTAPPRVARAPVTSLDEQLLRLLMREPALARHPQAEDALPSIPEGSVARRVIEMVLAADTAPSMVMLQEAFRDTEDGPDIERAATSALDIELAEDALQEDFLGALQKFRADWRRKRMDEIVGNPALRDEYIALMQEQSVGHRVAAT
jgi:DNA primase